MVSSGRLRASNPQRIQPAREDSTSAHCLPCPNSGGPFLYKPIRACRICHANKGVSADSQCAMPRRAIVSWAEFGEVCSLRRSDNRTLARPRRMRRGQGRRGLCWTRSASRWLSAEPRRQDQIPGRNQIIRKPAPFSPDRASKRRFRRRYPCGKGFGPTVSRGELGFCICDEAVLDAVPGDSRHQTSSSPITRSPGRRLAPRS